ncbi:hypothetical protein AX14_005236, partial [Amanita brunnescens Koide BX004]
MQDNSDKNCREDQTRRSWWNKARRFIINNCGMYDMGDNANLKLSENHINARTVMIVDRLTIDASHVDQGEANERDQHKPGQFPVAQVSHGSRDELEADKSPLVETSGYRDELKLDAPQIMFVDTQIPLQTNRCHSESPPDPVNMLEPEATADYTDPDVPLNCSTAYSRTSRARTHIYSLEMLIHGAGYPLYMPTPSIGLPPAYRKNGIRVGDVGVITANGAFEYLFNVCRYHDQDEGVTPTMFPGHLEPLKPDIRVNHKFATDTYLPSDRVSEVNKHNVSTDFRCSEDEGAVLALPKGATVYEVRNRHDFQTYAARHAVSWYEYAFKIGMDIFNGSLYFVTECTKTTDWGIAVFYARQAADDYLRFIFDRESYQWKRQGKVEARVGSKSGDKFDCNIGEPNQCAFLRGYKMMLRQDIWGKIKFATV